MSGFLAPPGGGSGGGSSGATALSSLTNATATNSLTISANTQTWNISATADGAKVFNLTENIASSGGTSTSGVPNQVLCNIGTIGASTMSPLQVKSRGNHVFSVSPTASQMLITDGSAGTPAFALASSTGTGLFADAATGHIGISASGTRYLLVTVNQVRVTAGGSATAPSLTDDSSHTCGLFWGSHFMGIGDTTAAEIARFAGSGTAQQFMVATTNSHATVTVQGGLSLSAVSINSTQTLNTTHAFVMCNNVAGTPITVVLPTATNNGQAVTIKRTNGPVTVQSSGTDSIETANTTTLVLTNTNNSISLWALAQSTIWYRYSSIGL